jgi:hypothetical protein
VQLYPTIGCESAFGASFSELFRGAARVIPGKSGHAEQQKGGIQEVCIDSANFVGTEKYACLH